MRLASLLVLLAGIVAQPVGAQVQRTLIRDVRPGPASSAPWRFSALGDTLLFIADSTGDNGPEIWGTDGRDAWRVFTPPDTTIGQPRVIGRLGRDLYFVIDDALWYTDGVTTDTVHTGVTSPRTLSPCAGRFPAAVLADRIVFAAGGGCQVLAVNRDSSWAAADPSAEGGPAGVAQYMFEHGGSAYIFWGYAGGTGRSVYRASGVPGDHTQVLDPEPDTTRRPWQMVTRYDGRYYFESDRGGTGEELWRWDGAGAPEIVADLVAGAGSSLPRSGFVALGNLFFLASTGPTGRELRAYDGTAVTTPFEVEPGPGPPATVVQLNHREAAGALYFWVRSGTDATDTYTLHSWDGTAHRTITTGLGDDRFHEAGHVVGAAGRAWFDGCDVAGVHGASLWWTDGTTASLAIGGSPDVCTSARPFMAMAESDDALLARIDDPLVGIEPFLIRPQGTVDAPDDPSSALALSVSPNPARDRVAIGLHLPASGTAAVHLFDMTGRHVATLHDGPAAAGALWLALDPGGLTPGVYLLRADTPVGAVTRLVTVTR